MKSMDDTARPASPPRVLLIANTAWYLRNFRAQLVERLERAGYEVVLVKGTRKNGHVN
jgi:hypothetical protein